MLSSVPVAPGTSVGRCDPQPRWSPPRGRSRSGITRAQRGGFYGGWITGDIGGPFKGEPGTEGWKREQYTLSDPHRALF